MGNAPVVKLTADADSPTEPGAKSIVSDPLPRSVQMEPLWEACVAYCKYPVSYLETFSLKQVDLKEVSPNEFLVKVVLDGAKLDQWGYGKGDGTDRITCQHRLRLDWDKKELSLDIMRGQCWVGEEEGDDAVYFVSTTRFFQPTPPIAYEYVWEVKVGDEKTPPGRITTDGIAQINQAVMDPICKKVADTKEYLLADVDSPSGAGKSIVSPALDGYTNYDKLFNCMIDVMKKPRFQGEEIIHVSGTQFKRQHVDFTGKSVTMVTYDKEKGEVDEKTTKDGGRPAGSQHRRLHREPLVFEAWTVDSTGLRAGNKPTASLLQLEFNAILNKTAGWWPF